MANLIIQENGVARTRPAVTGEEITVRTPCSCSDVTGVQINGVVFPFYDAMGNSLGNTAGLFDTNSLIRVLLDTDNKRAYILNADTNAYLERKFADKAPLSHTTDKSNPHGVTASQVGLGNVNNTSDSDKPVSTAQAAAIADAKKAGTDAQIGLNTHSGNKSNPHGVTKSQVGLGNVPNVATNDQVPTFTQASGLANLVSGEKLSVSLGKVMKAIAELISHIGNKSNPHGVTAAQTGAVPTTRTVNGKALSSDITLAASDVSAVPSTRTVNGRALSSDITLSASDVGARPSTWTPSASDVGAAPTSHNHSASQITSGTLSDSRLPTVPVTKGGTGATSAPTARANLGITSGTADPSGGSSGDIYFQIIEE